MTQHERRNAPRADARFPIRLSVDNHAPDAGAGFQDAELKDISTNGLACRYHGEAMSEMTLMAVNLELPGSDAAHRIEGVVVRCEKVRGISPPTYEVAIYFTEIGATAREAIRTFVNTALTKTATG